MRLTDNREIVSSNLTSATNTRITMIGTLTISQAVIGFLGFLGINNFKDLTNTLYGFVGIKQDGIEIIQTDNDVEIRKDGKLLIKFDIDSIEEMFDTVGSQPDFIHESYEDFIINHWDKLSPKPTITKVWHVGEALMLSTKYGDTQQVATIKIRSGKHATARIECLAELYK